jgi:hypothetical protein
MPLRQACATRVFHVVSAEQVAASLPYDRLIPALRQAFAAGAQVPPRHHHPIPVPGEPDATLLLMPAWQTGGYLGVKIIGIFPGNTARGLPGPTRPACSSWGPGAIWRARSRALCDFGGTLSKRTSWPRRRAGDNPVQGGRDGIGRSHRRDHRL